MSDLVAMIAVAKGTIAASAGIIHVDPRNHREDGRYSRPLVKEVDAVLLEKRKLAVRESDLHPAVAELVNEDGSRMQLLPGEAVQLGQAIEGQALLPVSDDMSQGSQQSIDAPPAGAAAAGAAEAGSGPVASGDLAQGATAEIATGLGDDDADMAPAPAPAPAPAAAAATAKTKVAPSPGKTPQPQR